MIQIITGAVNHGKSTHLRSIYQERGCGDGFYNRRVYHEGSLAGQEIVHLATGESRLVVAIDGFIPENWHEECRYGAFSFSREGLDFGRGILQNALEHHIEPLFIDEIGPLELEGQGFSKVFSNLLVASVEMVVVVRESCLDSVTREFKIKDYRVVDIDRTVEGGCCY